MTQNKDQLDIVLPCYNPDLDFIQILASAVAALQSIYPEKKIHLIVSNDGSSQNFGSKERAALLESIPGTDIVGSEQHAGKGAAVRAGIAASRAAHTIYMDIDIPYSLETMKEVIDNVLQGNDIVIAVRNKSYFLKLSLMRKMISHGLRFMNMLFLRTRHTDTQGGLKGLSPKAREIMLRTKINDYLFDTEFIVLASRDKNLSIVEIESTLRKDAEFSKMSLKVIFRELRNFLKILTLP